MHNVTSLNKNNISPGYLIHILFRSNLDYLPACILKLMVCAIIHHSDFHYDIFVVAYCNYYKLPMIVNRSQRSNLNAAGQWGSEPDRNNYKEIEPKWRRHS